METFSALLALCVGNSPVSGEFPAQRPVTRSFDVFIMTSHYDVIMMISFDAMRPMVYVIVRKNYCVKF